MHEKAFQVDGVTVGFTARLGGETGRTVLIMRNDRPEPPFVTLDPVDHHVAHELQRIPDDEFLELAIIQARRDGLIEKALHSGGPVVAMFKHERHSRPA